MLVLARNKDQKVVLTLPNDPDKLAALAGHSITVTVVDYRLNCLKLGFDADHSISILREELLDAFN